MTYLQREAVELLRDGCNDPPTLRLALRASLEREAAWEAENEKLRSLMTSEQLQASVDNA